MKINSTLPPPTACTLVGREGDDKAQDVLESPPRALLQVRTLDSPFWANFAKQYILRQREMHS